MKLGPQAEKEIREQIIQTEVKRLSGPISKIANDEMKKVLESPDFKKWLRRKMKEELIDYVAEEGLNLIKGKDWTNFTKKISKAILK